MFYTSFLINCGQHTSGSRDFHMWKVDNLEQYKKNIDYISSFNVVKCKSATISFVYRIYHHFMKRSHPPDPQHLLNTDPTITERHAVKAVWFRVDTVYLLGEKGVTQDLSL